MLVDAGSQRSRSAAVHHTHLGKMGQIGVVQIFIKLRNGLVHSKSDQIDLRGNGEGFGHLDSALGGAALLSEGSRRAHGGAGFLSRSV